MRRSTHFEQFAAPSAAAPVFEPLGSAEVVAHAASGVRLRTGPHTVEVAALAPDLFRVGLFGDGRPVDYRSEAVPKQDWQPSGAQVASETDEVRISTGLATAHI